MLAPKQKIFEHPMVAVAAYFKSYYKNIGPRTEYCDHYGCDWVPNYNEKGERINLMKCKNVRWIPYEPQELAQPTLKPEAACVVLDVAHRNTNGWGGTGDLVKLNFLYDLMEDKLVANYWFQTYSNGTNEGLLPHTGKAKGWPPPSELVNLPFVLDGVKRSI